MLSIVTNVSLYDSSRIKTVLPHWLRVFDKVLYEVVVIFDEILPTGRIAELHKRPDKKKDVLNSLEYLSKMDSRIKPISLDYSKLKDISKKWFQSGNPIRSQGGTPIFPFVFAIELAEKNFILKIDCDVVFYNNGFLDKALILLKENNFDLIEPPRLFYSERPTISTRAFFINYNILSEKLPLKAYKTDFIKQIYRLLKRRPAYLAFEEILQKEILKGKIKYLLLNEPLGFSMHIPRKDQFEKENIGEIVLLFESGKIPDKQKKSSWDYCEEHWLKSNF